MIPRQAEYELPALQRWFLSVITHPDGVLEGARSPDAQQQIAVSPDELERVIRRSRSQTSVERLEVYANAYYARLIECLAEEFPAMEYVLGAETFRAFAFEYLQHYPPGSYTLAKLAASFPRFLRETRPIDSDGGGKESSWTDFLIDLATLERTYSEVFDSRGPEEHQGLQYAELASIPPEAWPSTKFVPVDCLRLLELRFPVHEFAAAVKRGQEPSIPRPISTHLMVTRRDYIVRPRAVSKLEYDALQGLCGGKCVGDVITKIAESCEMDNDQLSVQIHDWFHRWSADGLFVRVFAAD